MDLFKRNIQNTAMQPVSQNASIDEELEKILARQKAKIKVVGAGGGGNNTINRITAVGISGEETINVFDRPTVLIFKRSR